MTWAEVFKDIPDSIYKMISKDPPFYIWSDCCWYNEKDKRIYKPEIDKNAWVCDDKQIPFRENSTIFFMESVYNFDGAKQVFKSKRLKVKHG